VPYLTDILVADLADLLNVGGTLRDVLDGVSAENELILLGLGSLNIDTRAHGDTANDLLANEVPDLDLPQIGLGVLVEADVDGEMGVDVTHLVLEALGDTDDHVLDDGLDGAESGDVLANAVVDLNGDDIALGVREGDGEVTKVLLKLAAGALDGDLTGLDVDLDCSRRRKVSMRAIP
jgi:hypothetical protein